MVYANKSLGQHWLFDKPSLEAVVRSGEVTKDDTVLEIGPGLGTLTQILCERARQVIAVEADPELALGLSTRVPAPNLEVVHGDILGFDLTQLPKDYKTVANIPYYLSSHLFRLLLESSNPPVLSSLLVQKEVAERITAGPGDMSVLAVSVQYYAKVSITGAVPKELFDPVPKVDSVILCLKRRPKRYFEADTKELFRLVKAGFGERRKQLKNSLAGGLDIDSETSEELLKTAGIAITARAQELSLDDWQKLYEAAEKNDILQ